jgi:hypothetical protein
MLEGWMRSRGGVEGANCEVEEQALRVEGARTGCDCL